MTTTPIEDLTRPPTAHATVVVGAGADIDPTDRMDIRELGPQGNQGAIYVRWMGAGPGVLWYKPMSVRQNYTISEGALGVPKASPIGPFVRLDFAAQYEAQFVQLTHLHGDSTAGTWVLGY